MANKTGAWGVESVCFADLVDKPVAATGAFPTDWTAFKMKAIVKDSLSFNDQAPSTNNIEIEDSDNYYATLQSDVGSEGFTIQTYDMSAEAAKFFFGFKEGKNDYIEEDPTFKLQNKAIQITTKETDEFPAKVFEWANMKLVVTKSGTIGKSGFPNINIECTKQAVFDDTTGKELPSTRWKTLAKGSQKQSAASQSNAVKA